MRQTTGGGPAGPHIPATAGGSGGIAPHGTATLPHGTATAAPTGLPVPLVPSGTTLPVPPGGPTVPGAPGGASTTCPSAVDCPVPTAILPGALLWAAWAVVLLLPVVAWGLASLIAGAGSGSRWGRGARALGPAVLVVVGALLLLRLIGMASPDLASPFAWLDLTGLTTLGQAATTGCCVRPRGTPAEALVLLASLEGYLLVLAAAVAAARQRGAQVVRKFQIPLAEAAGWFLLVAALAVIAGVQGPVTHEGRDFVLLDAVAFLPLGCVALALWARSKAEPERAAVQAAGPAQQAAAAVVDVPSLWRQAGALGPESRPLFSTNGSTMPAYQSAAVEVWREAGATGLPPGALDEAGRLFQAPFQGFLVGDLPDPTEEAFLCALILRAVQVEGVPVLVVTEGLRRDIDGTLRSPLRDSVEAAVRRSGAWSCGPLVVGERELRESIAGRRVPAAAFLDVDELSSQGIRALGRATGEGGALWARSVGLVVVSQIDRGAGLAVTHRMHTLRRLGLALRAAGSRWSVLATGFGGVATRSLLEQVFPGHAVREIPFAPRSTAPVAVWTAAEVFTHAPGLPWVRRASEPLVHHGLRVGVGDPQGSFDLRGLEVEVGKVSLVRDVALGGDASTSQLDDTWLLAGFRALSHRMPLASGAVHHALWGIEPNPVVRYLLRNGTLASLAQQGRVPAPRPLVGYGNRLLARAHLHAALREGEQDLESLAGIFGRPLVDQVVGEGYVAEHYVVRSVPSRDGLLRVPLAPTLTGEASNPLRHTVTEQVVRLVNRNGGRHLVDVDRVLAETRFYPGRVFAIGAERFEVPLHAYDGKRGEIQVEAVDETRPLTSPMLALEVADATMIEAIHEVREGKLAYGLGGFEVTVREQVSGLREASGRQIAYNPVSAQYRTRMRGIFFSGTIDERVLFHLARSLEGVLTAHLMATGDDLAVVTLRPGLIQGLGAGVGVVDRYVQGMGATETLDAAAVGEVLAWVRSILGACRCQSGCAECTPPDVVAPDKGGVLKLLGA